MKKIGLVALAAILGAVAVQLLTLVTHALSWICFLGEWRFTPPDISDSGLDTWIMLIPVIGALIGMLLIKFGKKRFTPLSALIITGTGFPYGVEGILAGGTWIFDDNKLLKAAMIVAGLACLMNAPVAAVVFALELGLLELTLLNVGMMVLAAAIGAGCYFVFHGWEAVFHLTSAPAISLQALYVYFAAGVVVALLGIFMTWVTKWLEKITFQRVWLPVIAAVIIGYLGWQWPEALSTGYYYIPKLAGGDVNLSIIIGLAFVRFVSLILAAGTGAPGRELMVSPLVVTGAAMGMMGVLLFSLLFKVDALTPGIAAIAGIAALLTGRYPIVWAALILSFEMTHQWGVVVPVLIAVIPAMLLRKMLVRTGIN